MSSSPVLYLAIAAAVLAAVSVAVLMIVRVRQSNPGAQGPHRSSAGPAGPADPAGLAGPVGPADPASTADAAPEAAPASEPPAPTFESGLATARRSLRDRLGSIRERRIDAQIWDRLTEVLVGADVGVTTAARTIDRLRAVAAERAIADADGLLEALGGLMRSSLTCEREVRIGAPDRPNATPVWLFVGVNGVGKTTTIGKVGHRLAAQGRSVVMAAADTFRAAASEQLQTWADRCGARMISASQGADPSSVLHDAVSAASARGADIVLADTAGRLHNRRNLMDELAKVRRVADREPGAVAETLLVIDATTGQNGLIQAKAFADATDVTGVVLTKLDGSAKGGIVFAIEAELGIPVKLVGLGEGARDLADFDPASYLDALLGLRTAPAATAAAADGQAAGARSPSRVAAAEV